MNLDQESVLHDIESILIEFLVFLLCLRELILAVFAYPTIGLIFGFKQKNFSLEYPLILKLASNNSSPLQIVGVSNFF